MTKSISRRRFMGHAAAAGAVAVAAGVPTSAFGSGAEAGSQPPDTDDLNFVHPLGPGDIPDLDHILPQGRGWKVLPTGIDDHDNMEWALCHTVAGGTVRLVSGVYKVGRPIVVADFDGVLVGAGAARTTITCTDELSVELWEMPGGGKERGELKPPPFPR
jgi:hypothetical protein